MGFSTCEGGGPFKAHLRRRTCDGCDDCPVCQNFKMAILRCERCCGELHGCPKCVPDMQRHIAESKGQKVLL